MPDKCGRPISGEVADPAQERQREAWRRQQQEHRKRRRAAQGQATSQPGELLGAGEQVIDLTVTEEESVAATLLQLGLRAQGLTLRQDPSASQLPQDAPDIEEHDHLYLTRDAAQPDRIFRQQKPPVGFFRRSAAPVGQPPASRPVPRQISHFYPSLPSSNPFNSSSAAPMARPNISVPPNADQPLAFSVPPSPATFHADDNVDFDAGASSGANEDACARSEAEKSQEAIEQSPERGEEGTRRRDTEEHGQAMAEGAGTAESLRLCYFVRLHFLVQQLNETTKHSCGFSLNTAQKAGMTSVRQWLKERSDEESDCFAEAAVPEDCLEMLFQLFVTFWTEMPSNGNLEETDRNCTFLRRMPARPESCHNTDPKGMASEHRQKPRAGQESMREFSPRRGSAPEGGKLGTAPKALMYSADMWHCVGGFRARWRGLGLSILYRGLHGAVSNLLAGVMGFGIVGHFISYTLVSLGLARVWTHSMIAYPSAKPFWRRIVPRKQCKAILMPSLVFAVAQQATIGLPVMVAFALGLPEIKHEHVMASAQHENCGKMVLLGLRFLAVPATAIFVALAVLLPASMTLTRIEATLLPEDEQTIVPFDKEAIVGELDLTVRGSSKALFVQAWRPVDRSARLRVVKLYAKMVLAQFTIVHVGLHLAVAELYLIGGERLAVFIQSGAAQLKLMAIEIHQQAQADAVGN
ncbi:hypothetical protein LTR48_001344 [Friedmanniomyces endolithicus]|nr:hypothetical protein LTR48_001344 [Friedmanniomyces endolithicus]